MIMQTTQPILLVIDEDRPKDYFYYKILNINFLPKSLIVSLNLLKIV